MTGTIFGRQPAAISAVISAMVKLLMLFGVIQLTTDQAIQLMLVVDGILALLVYQAVTPVAAPKLPLGTPVLVDGAGDQPPPDAIVALAGGSTVSVDGAGIPGSVLRGDGD